MTKKGKRLEFISQINRDGSGTHPVKESYIKMMAEDKFKIQCLSLSQKTFIASCFNSFVVRIKEKPSSGNESDPKK